MGLDWSALDPEVRAELAGLELDVDRARIDALADAIRAGELDADSNRIAGRVEPARDEDIDALDDLAAGERARLAERGRDAIERGEVAVAVLNGGMATRFGGVVKGVVEAVGGRSFLEIKCAQAGRTPLPLLCMNSFATHRSTLDHLAQRGLEARVRPFLQDVSLRLTPEGEVFRGADGSISLYAPGHGDFPEALRRAGLAAELRERGVRAVLLSNVDNLGAEPDPVVVGYHFAHGRPLTCEVALTRGDPGGAPARVDGRLQVVEAFRFPRDYDQRRNRFIATNTFAIGLEALERERPFTWMYVEKEVDGRRAVQLERLVNELSAHVATAFLGVPRDGPGGRFLPVKDRADLAALRADPVQVARFAA